MAVSKRLRFEILRRDNHTCYYCGHKPPEVELTIDHVVPKALGGSDVASNLVAACGECNGGKTSIAPGSPLVAQVDADAARWSAAMQAAIAKASADHEAVAAYREEFRQAWHSYSRPAPLDDGWRQSVENFRARGLPIGLLTDAVHRAMSYQQVRPDVKFRYVCKVAWNRIKEIEQDARRHVSTSAAGGEACDDIDAVAVDAIVAIWRASWLISQGTEPGVAMLAEVREIAEELYLNEEIDPGIDGMAIAANSAGWTQTVDLADWLDTEAKWSTWERAMRYFLIGWAGSDGGFGELPTEEHYLYVKAMAALAEGCGYGADAIDQAAAQAGRSRTWDLGAFLETVGAAWKREIGNGGYLAAVADVCRISDERMEELRREAIATHEENERRRAARKARGTDESPWGA